MALWRDAARVRRALAFLGVAAAAVALSAPLLVRVKRDLPLVEAGHPSKWCSVALTSLVIPSRIQALSAATAPLTGRNHQNLVEGVGYLGWIPARGNGRPPPGGDGPASSTSSGRAALPPSS